MLLVSDGGVVIDDLGLVEQGVVGQAGLEEEQRGALRVARSRDRAQRDAGGQLDGLGETVSREETDVGGLLPLAAGHVGEGHAVGADTGGDVGLLEPVAVALGDVDRHVDGVVTGEQALGVGGLDERLAVPHVVGVTVGEQDGAQGEPMGAKQSQRAAGGTGSGVDDEGGLARACGQDVAVGGEHGCDGALQDHAPTLLGPSGISVDTGRRAAQVHRTRLAHRR